MNLFERILKLEQQVGQLATRTFILYAKGTYVVTYLGATSAGVTTYTTQDGFYVRIGNVVFFNGRVVWTAATGTGNAIVSLPFTAQNTTGMRYAIRLFITNVTFANGSVQAAIAPGGTTFNMASPATNAASTAVAVEAAGDIIFSGWFRV